MSTDPRVEAAARALNTAGWTCHEGNDEPGEYDRCAECKRHCDELATAALTAADNATITDRGQLDGLPDNSVIMDSSGDVGVVLNGRIWYAETLPMAMIRAARYLPARVLHFGGTA